MKTQGPTHRCVIADDVRASRELLTACLSNLGVEVEACCDGKAAWEAIQRSAPSLIVTDIEMPRMTGLDLLRQVRERKDAEFCRVPVVLMTSLLDSEISDIANQYGAATVLIKPLCKVATCQVVERLLRGDKVDLVYDPHSSMQKINGGQAISPTLRRLLREAES